MKVFELFSDYIFRLRLDPRTVADCHDAIVSLLNEQITPQIIKEGKDKGNIEPLTGEQQILHSKSFKVRTDLAVMAKKLAADGYGGRLDPKKKVPGSVYNETDFIKKQFGDFLAKVYTEAREEWTKANGVEVGDYHYGKPVPTTAGMVIITITRDAWSKIEKGAGNPAQIRGILAKNPVEIRNRGNFKGVRCIKPELYGWVFSTSCGLRLVDDKTSTLEWPPRRLTFNTTKAGH